MAIVTDDFAHHVCKQEKLLHTYQKIFLSLMIRQDFFQAITLPQQSKDYISYILYSLAMSAKNSVAIYQ